MIIVNAVGPKGDCPACGCSFYRKYEVLASIIPLAFLFLTTDKCINSQCVNYHKGPCTLAKDYKPLVKQEKPEIYQEKVRALDL